MVGGGGSHKPGRRRVVVVGGGVAGAMLAKSLQDHAAVTLIDPKEYFEIPWTNLRSKVELSVAAKSLISHSDYLVNCQLITASAVDVTEEAVVTLEGRLVEYTYLVIAMDHSNQKPRNRRDRLEQFQEDNMKIKNSESILIIGGGAAGVELAAEIAVGFPDKKVTLIHNGPRLLEFMGWKAGNKAQHWLNSKNVEVLLDQSVDLESMSEGDSLYKTSAGIEITADCHFLCIDKPLSSSWIRDSELKDCLDDDGRLMVDANLRVRGHSKIFAIGDITDIPEIKQGYFAQRHAMVVAKNIKLLMDAADDSKLLKYKPSSALPMVSLGRKDAVVQFPFGTVAGHMPGMIKSRDLFVSKTRRQLGLPR